VSKNYYELLDLDPSASADDIKKAFRREITRYHPDKVQHLGAEFQEIAAVKTAELTEAYRVLMDPALRAEYDESVASANQAGHSGAAAGPRESSEFPETGLDTGHSAAGTSDGPADAVADPEEPPAAPPTDEENLGETPDLEPVGIPASRIFQRERETRDDFIRRAAVAKFREIMAASPEPVHDAPTPGFDLAYLVRPRAAGLFRKSDPPIRVLTRFVPSVDALAVQRSWSLARRAGLPQGEVPCVIVFGDRLAPSGELAAAILRERNQDRGTPLVLVPVDVRNWEALMPTDAPPAVRGIIDRLRNVR
jgi:curved DNA-binding protein CbpA